MKLRQLIEAREAFERLIVLKLPIKAAYRLQKLARKIHAELADYDQMRNEVILRLGVPEGEIYRISPEKAPEFVAEMNSLEDEEVELGFTPLKIADLGDIQIAPVDILLLSFLIEDEEV